MLTLLITILGLLVGGLVARSRGENQAGIFWWLVAGVIPGAALMVAEPWYMLFDILLVPLLLMRRRSTQIS